MELHNICRQIHYRKLGSLSLPSNHSFAVVLPGDSVVGLVVATGLANFLNLYNTLLVVRLVLTWFPNAPPAIVSPLSTICHPPALEHIPRNYPTLRRHIGLLSDPSIYCVECVYQNCCCSAHGTSTSCFNQRRRCIFFRRREPNSLEEEMDETAPRKQV